MGFMQLIIKIKPWNILLFTGKTKLHIFFNRQWTHLKTEYLSVKLRMLALNIFSLKTLRGVLKQLLKDFFPFITQ